MIPVPARGGLKAIGLLLVLNIVIGFAFCSTYLKFTFESWKVPSHYLSVEHTDTLTTLATLKALTEGDFGLFRFKSVKRLGAPGEGNWNDFPSTEEIPFGLFGVLARVFGPTAALNLSLLLGHLLAGTCFFLVARYFSVSVLYAFIGGLAFGLSPFFFAQSPHHIVIQYAWHTPLFLIVWNWIIDEEGIKFRSTRFWFSIFVALLAGLQNIYYTYAFCQFVAIGAVIQLYRKRDLGEFLSSSLIVASALLTIFLMNLDTLWYQIKEGPNPGVLVRPYFWLEVYALKFISLITPPINHQIGFLANWGQLYKSQTILNDEGSYLGIMGLTSLGLLVTVSLLPFLKKLPKCPPAAFWQILWLSFFFTTGGLNGLQGIWGITYFRTGCRYSIFILVIALLFGAKRLTQIQKSYLQRRPPELARSWTVSIALLAMIIIFVDQVPRSVGEREDIKWEFLYHSDKEFTEVMETALPRNAMVFQLPIMAFPESPVQGIDSYNHLRPYIYSKHLRFSFGNNKGRSSDDWQASVANLSFEALIDKLISTGFSGLYVNKNGYPDQAEGLVTAMKSLGFDKPLESRSKDLIFFNLGKRKK